MAPEYEGSAGPDASTVPLADGGAEGGAAEGPSSGGRPAYHLDGKAAESLGNTRFFSSNVVQFIHEK